MVFTGACTDEDLLVGMLPALELDVACAVGADGQSCRLSDCRG